ncbi:MAG: polymer-forming cytoskeletal protein [Actinomycetia bacterium]|nr:polymer-forming cytoskeletal protein [Actinomycetes bacterium]
MKKILAFFLVAVSIIFISATPLWALEVKDGDNSDVSISFGDDLFAFGPDILIVEDIAGDLIMAGGRVSMNGNTAQDLMAFGGSVILQGDVGDDIRVSGGTIDISGNIEDDLMAIGGQINISEAAVIGGELAVSGGTIDIACTTGGDAYLSGATITISGKIDGDVNIDGVESLKVTDTAEITGDLVYSSSVSAAISDGAVIGGEVRETIVKETEGTEVIKTTPWAVFTATYIGGRVIAFLGLFVLGIILILAMPGFLQRFNDRMKKSPGLCVGSGAIVLFGVPIGSIILFIISIILFITIIGSGLGIVVMASNFIMMIVYGVLIYISAVFLSYLLGRVILSKTSLNMGRYGWKVLAYFIGLVIIMTLYSIPFVGWIIKLAGILFGLGGLALVLKDMLAGSKK